MATYIVLPGDHVGAPSTSSVKLGPGLSIDPTSSTSSNAELIATAPGILGSVPTGSTQGKGQSSTSQAPSKGSRHDGQLAMWVESNNKRYVPLLHDHVICQITNRGTESYTVSLLNSHTQASLPALAFEGATKRNKPNLRVGTLVYAQVSVAQRQAEVEVTCVDATTGKSNGFGELKSTAETSAEAVKPPAASSTAARAAKPVTLSGGGTTATIWPVSCGLARSLLNPSHTLLAATARHFPFEVAIGVNGFVWVRAQSAQHVIAIGKILQKADADGRHWNAQTPNDEGDALQWAQKRGVLDSQTIAQIIEPFK